MIGTRRRARCKMRKQGFVHGTTIVNVECLECVSRAWSESFSSDGQLNRASSNADLQIKSYKLAVPVRSQSPLAKARAPHTAHLCNSSRMLPWAWDITVKFHFTRLTPTPFTSCCA